VLELAPARGAARPARGAARPARGAARPARGAMFCRISALAPGFCAGRSLLVYNVFC
ncbi:hypothetical protein A2U01_0089024, partial [Trifolium medium]|nr:hypothetical protein [Trifolium medium]